MKSKIAILLIISLFGADANAQFLDKLKDFAEKLEDVTEEIEKTLQNDETTNSEISPKKAKDTLVQTPDYRVSAEYINSVPKREWVLVWGGKYARSIKEYGDAKVYIDTAQRSYPSDIGIYKFVENGVERVEILSHFCKNDMTSPNYISNVTISSIQAFKLNSEGVYEETETTDQKYSYNEPTGRVHFYFCEEIRNYRARDGDFSLKRRAMNGNLFPESAYFQDGIKYDANFIPYRNTVVRIRPRNYCSPFFAYTGADALALVWIIKKGVRFDLVRNAQPATVDQINVDFISKYRGATSSVLTKECLDMNFNSFMKVLVKNENWFKNFYSATPSFVGDGKFISLPSIEYNRNKPPSDFLNNPKGLSMEEIREIYIKNFESTDPARFNEIACPEYFESKKVGERTTLYHIYTGELVTPEHLSGDQFMTRGFAEEDVSNDCMELMFSNFKKGGMKTNNPKGLKEEELEMLYEKNHYKVYL